MVAHRSAWATDLMKVLTWLGSSALLVPLSLLVGGYFLLRRRDWRPLALLGVGLGVRIIQLTYNSRNLLGDGCTERVQTGLSQFGVDAVRRMNEVGVVVDTGHCSDPTTLDAVEASERPVMVTHAFCRSVSDHDRGKSDDVIRTVGESGGYFGVVTVPFFITDDPNPRLDHWLAHVDRAVELAGVDHVGLGSDFDGVSGQLPQGVSSAADLPNITAALLERGYTADQVHKILGGNLLRAFRDVERVAREMRGNAPEWSPAKIGASAAPARAAKARAAGANKKP